MTCRPKLGKLGIMDPFIDKGGERGIGVGVMGIGTIGQPTLPVWLITRGLGPPVPRKGDAI